MAKTSSIEKNNRRKKLSKQFAAKRAKLKALSKDQSVSMEDRFGAQLKLAALPRNVPCDIGALMTLQNTQKNRRQVVAIDPC